MATRPLLRFRNHLLQTGSNVSKETVSVLPANKKLLVKKIDCMFVGGGNWTLTTIMETDVSIYIRKNETAVYADANLVYKFFRRTYNEGTNRFIEVTPFDIWTWTPPPGYFLYGDYLAARLKTVGYSSALEVIVDIYGTLSDANELEVVQEIAKL